MTKTTHIKLHKCTLSHPKEGIK